MKYNEALTILLKIDDIASRACVPIDKRMKLLRTMKDRIKNASKIDRITDTLDKIVDDHDVDKTITEYLDEVKREARSK